MVELFGGAISVPLPPDVIDVSNFRQVPDNQEVFLIERGDNPQNDKSLIIEILETPQTPLIKLALRLHVSDLIEQEPETIKEDDIKYKVVDNKQLGGTNYMLVYNYQQITIIIGVIRIESHSTDILVSMNVKKNNVANLDCPSSDVAIVQKVVESLTINDWHLFG